MHTLSVVPTPNDAIIGDLNGEVLNSIAFPFQIAQQKIQWFEQVKGVIGVRSGGQVIKIFPGALRVLQAIHAGKYPGAMRLATASSATTPKAVQIAKAAIAILEVAPGV